MNLRTLKWTLIAYMLFDLLLGYAGFIPLTELAAAQFTQVSGTIVDPNGVAYALGTISAGLVTSASPTLNGLAYTPPTQPVGLDLTGSFTMQLADNSVLLPAATKWTFLVCSAIGTVQPAGGPGPVCFTTGPLTISGTSQNISAQLNTAALALAPPSGRVAIPKAARWSYNGISNGFFASSGADLVVTDSGGASTVAGTSAEGWARRFTTGAVSGNTAGYASNFSNPNGPWLVGRNLYQSSYVRDSNADLTNQRLFLGLASPNYTDANMNSDTPCAANAIKCAMFRFSSVAADTNWQCITGTGAAQTTTNSGIAADTNFHRFEIQFNDPVSSVSFKIDGILVCTNTTNLPASTTLNTLHLIITQTAAAKTLDVGWIYGQQNF